jgi:hypothetical protein
MPAPALVLVWSRPRMTRVQYKHDAKNPLAAPLNIVSTILRLCRDRFHDNARGCAEGITMGFGGGICGGEWLHSALGQWDLRRHAWGYVVPGIGMGAGAVSPTM